MPALVVETAEGPLLNTNSEVIGIVQGSVLDIEPGWGDLAQGLNIAVPSKYLTPLVETAKIPNRTIKPLSVDGVTGRHLTWGGNDYEFYEFSVCNRRFQFPTITIHNIHCLVIFKDKQGQIICADEVLIPTLPICWRGHTSNAFSHFPIG